MIYSDWVYSNGYYYYRIEKDRIVISMLPEVAEDSVNDKIYITLEEGCKARVEMHPEDKRPRSKTYPSYYKESNECYYHEPVQYTGLNEVYKYCRKCGKKGI